ncbi:MAG TPA: bacteriohopanetetrol glucosamine biosynthesis glycosyltransferase HpnI [Caulobacteraceae bacterium]
MLIAALGWGVGLLAVCGDIYMALAAVLIPRFMARPGPASPHLPAVSVIKPLHQKRRGLEACLESFCRQDYPAPVQFVFGVERADDPAIEVVRRLQSRHPALDITLVINPLQHGANRKVSNLINICTKARHPVLVLSDSDIEVGRSYLREVVAPLGQPDIGAVTCLYVGQGGGLWSNLSAMAINYQFLPSVILGRFLGLAQPCFGSTIAINAEVLAEIGGFEAFADHLADDYEIGRATRAKGYKIAIPAMAVCHHCALSGPGDLIGHELRWGRVVRLIDRAGFAGSLVTHSLSLSLIAAALLSFSPLSIGLIFATFCLRIALKLQVDAATGTRAGSWWLLPLRDLISFGVFLASFAVNTVHWQGRRFHVGHGGVLVPL